MIERQLQTAVNNILKWCDTNGHSISASKSCCVHFCRKRGIHPDPEIRIRDIQIPVVPDVRFLGVIFDRRLTFLPHILHLRKKCEKSLNLLKVLSNTSWGADRTSLLRVYQAPETEILEEFSGQGVIQVRRITIKKDAEIIPTKHLILTFNNPKLPTTIKAGYLNCKIRPYIPNPLRCFQCQRFGHSHTACRGQLTCSRCATVGHPSTDCTLEPKCVNCSQSHPSDSKLCSQWKTEKEIQIIKTNRNLTYLEARKTNSSTIIPILRSVAAVNKSSTSTQAELVPSTSLVTVASPSISQPPNSVIDTAPTISNSLSISATSSSSTACSVLETTTTISNTIPATSQDTIQTSKPRRKKRPPKNQSNTVKPKIEIKTAPHRPRKSGPTEYTTDEEDMIIYDVEDEPGAE
ncbi:uncharacterized protein TNCV_3159941 [Trichonephila clavipes]|nr:uncharacterized protein TNCV_3159941 [Trichonephila clavipes]